MCGSYKIMDVRLSYFDSNLILEMLRFISVIYDINFERLVFMSRICGDGKR